MLSKEEKLKIELEEKYRHEVNGKFKSKSKIDYIETVTKIVQGVAIAVGIFFTYMTYAGKSKEDSAQTAKEFRKTFYEKQFQFYTEATDAASILATEDFGSKDYLEARKTFKRLYWGRAGIVEDDTFCSSMIAFNSALIAYEADVNEDSLDMLKSASLKLAHDVSRYTVNVWLDSNERKKYPSAAEKSSE